MDPAPKAAVRKKKASPAAAGTGPAIAITGATGFLGSNLLSLLRTDEHFERIVVLDINKPPLPVRKTRYYKTDLTSKWSIRFGAPVDVSRLAPDVLEDDIQVNRLNEDVRQRVQQLLFELLKERRSAWMG